MSIPTAFRSGASVVISTVAGAPVQHFDLPPADGDMPDLVVENLSLHSIHLAFGAGAQAAPEATGTMTLKGRQSALISGREGAAALKIPLAQVNAPHWIHGGPSWELAWAQNAAAAASVSVLAHGTGGTITITRGSCWSPEQGIAA